MDNSTSASSALAKALDAYPGMYLSPDEFACLLSVSVQHVYNQIDKGALPAMRSGRLIRIHKHDIHVYCRTS